MKDYKSVWKKLVHSGSANRINHLQYCILKAMSAKSNLDKKLILEKIVRKSFTPITNKVKLANGQNRFDGIRYSYNYDSVLNIPFKEFFDNDAEIALFRELRDSITPRRIDVRYAFFFVANDMPAVHKVVQAAHVAYVAGHNVGVSTPENTHFVIFGIDNMQEAIDFLDHHQIRYEKFIEPDMDNKITAIATGALPLEYKKKFRGFNLLTI